MAQSVTRVALIRHGMTDWNEAGRLQGRTNVPLNDIGRRQARQAATALQAEPWDALYTSPLARAYETGEIIGDTLNLQPQIIANLTERNFGHLEGLTRDELNQKYPDRAHDVPVGVESPEALRTRAEACLAALASAHPGGGIVVVSHGAWINAFLYRVSAGVQGTGITNLSNGGITRIEFEPESGWKVLAINLTAHLDYIHGITDRDGTNRKVVGRRRNDRDAPRG